LAIYDVKHRWVGSYPTVSRFFVELMASDKPYPETDSKAG